MFENIPFETILIVLGVLLIIWVGLRFIFHFTKRIFTCGVTVLILLGAIWLLFKFVF